MIQNQDKAIISKKLVTLKKDVPVKDKISEFELKEIDKKKLYEFLREMEFNRLLSSVISTYGDIEFSNKEKSINNQNKIQKISNKNYELIQNVEDINKWLNEAEENGEIAVDTETSSLDPHQAKLIGISFSTKIGRACYIPVGHTKAKNIDETKVIKKIKPILEDKSIKKIGQNFKFDTLYYIIEA